MNNHFQNPRLKSLEGKPERVIATTVDSELLVEFGEAEQEKLNQELAAQALARLLSQARANSGLSVRKVAALLQRHPSRVGAIEQGNPDMAFRTFVEYAHAIGYSVEVKLIPTKSKRKALREMLPRPSTKTP